MGFHTAILGGSTCRRGLRRGVAGPARVVLARVGLGDMVHDLAAAAGDEGDQVPDKAETNLRRHRVDFDMAIKVFLDPWRIETEQEDDDDGRARGHLSHHFCETG